MGFDIALLDEVCAAMNADHRDNFDHYRFSEETPPRQAGARFLQPYLEDFERLFDMLSNEESRQLLIKVLAYRILGHRRIRLPLSTPAYWDAVKSIEALAVSGDYIQLSFLAWRLPRLPLHAIGLPLELYGTPMAVHTQFLVRQYAYQAGTVSIGVHPGDIIIDAGACWGDSTLFFAMETGEAGRIGSEPMALASSVQTLRRFRPRLAIAIYPSLHDFTKIPQWISSLGLGYRLYLGHASVHEEETVLVAESPERGES